MIKQIRNIVFYLITMCLLVAAVFFYRQTFLVVLLLLMLLLPPLSICLCRRCFATLSVGLSFSAAEAEKDLPVQLAFSFHNPTIFPLPHVECVFSMESPYYEKKQDTIYILPAEAGSTVPLELPVTYQYCGLFEAKITSVKVYDYLHFASFSRETDAHAQVCILPDSTMEVEYHPSFYAEGFDEYEATTQKGNVSSNVTDVREYQPGDRLQKIHWKLSAKIDKLMVKENEATSSHQFYVLLELYQSLEQPEILDLAVEYAYAVSRELLLHQETFFFGFYSMARGEFASFPIKCEGDLIEALCEAYYESPYTEEDLALQMYQDSGMQKGTLLQITHKGVSDEEGE
jgi:uncharacterized protein (DUF58 family)